MVARINTVAFQGIEAVPVDVQVQISSGFVGFTIVGLPDKAVAESRERIRAALTAVGLSLPPNASPSTSPRPTCPRPAAITIWPLLPAC